MDLTTSSGGTYWTQPLAYSSKPITFALEAASVAIVQLYLLHSSVIPINLSDLLSSKSISKVGAEKTGVTDNEARKIGKAGMKPSQLWTFCKCAQWAWVPLQLLKKLKGLWFKSSLRRFVCTQTTPYATLEAFSSIQGMALGTDEVLSSHWMNVVPCVRPRKVTLMVPLLKHSTVRLISRACPLPNFWQNFSLGIKQNLTPCDCKSPESFQFYSPSWPRVEKNLTL